MKKKKPKFFWEEPFDKIESSFSEGDIFKNFENIQRNLLKNFGRIGFSVRMPRVPRHFSRTQLMDKGDVLVFRTELPGFKKEEISLDINDNEIRLNARKKRFSRNEERDFFRAGASQTQISKVFTLPVSVDASKADATLEDGVLTVSVPKLKIKGKSRKVKIK